MLRVVFVKCVSVCYKEESVQCNDIEGCCYMLFLHSSTLLGEPVISLILFDAGDVMVPYTLHTDVIDHKP